MKAETLIIKALDQTVKELERYPRYNNTTVVLEYFRTVMLEMLATERQREEAEEKRLVQLGAEMSDPNL